MVLSNLPQVGCRISCSSFFFAFLYLLRYGCEKALVSPPSLKKMSVWNLFVITIVLSNLLQVDSTINENTQHRFYLFSFQFLQREFQFSAGEAFCFELLGQRYSDSDYIGENAKRVLITMILGDLIYFDNRMISLFIFASRMFVVQIRKRY